jgi:hypothetical protein
LEGCTPYRVYAFVTELVEPETGVEIWEAVASAVLAEDGGERGARPGARARNAVRLTALARAAASGGRQALGSVADGAQDPHTRAVALAAVGEARRGEVFRVEGRTGRMPVGGIRAVLRWVCGWAVLSWLGRMLLGIVRVKRDVELEIIDDALWVRRQTEILGRVIRRGEEMHRLSTVEAAARRVRYPALHLLLGALSLSAGVLLGVLFFYDALRIGDWVLFLAALVIFLGAGLDLLLDTLFPGRAGRVSLVIRTATGARLCVTGVDVSGAERFLSELSRRIAQ